MFLFLHSQSKCPENRTSIKLVGPDSSLAGAKSLSENVFPICQGNGHMHTGCWHLEVPLDTPLVCSYSVVCVFLVILHLVLKAEMVGILKSNLF